MRLSLAHHGPYPLFDLIRPAGPVPPPLDFRTAEGLDARARVAYHAGDYGLAAGLFRDLARLLTTVPDAAHAITRATDRAYAERNATAAAAMARAGSLSDEGV